MRIALWLFRFAIFVILLGFAMENTGPIQLKFFFDAAWDAPLVMILLAFFVAGVAIGIAALLGVVFRLKRENAQLRRRLVQGEALTSAAVLLHPPREL